MKNRQKKKGLHFPERVDIIADGKDEKEFGRMKKDIHPQYYQAVVHCACGETFVTGSTKKELNVEICSKCHPFFTGRQKLVDSGGRVDRFKKRYGM